jgi:cytochrome c oxidase subunit IV
MTTQGTNLEAHAGSVHVVPFWVLALVLGALLVLTWVTVAATWFEWGGLNLWIAMGIATVKASLVLLFFMHLRYESPLYGLVLIAALVFLALFIGLAMLDTETYQPDLIPGYSPGMSSSAPEPPVPPAK